LHPQPSQTAQGSGFCLQLGISHFHGLTLVYAPDPDSISSISDKVYSFPHHSACPVAAGLSWQKPTIFSGKMTHVNPVEQLRLGSIEATITFSSSILIVILTIS
jgi:hypothetical protein